MELAGNLWIRRLGLVAILLLWAVPIYPHVDNKHVISHDHESSQHHNADAGQPLSGKVLLKARLIQTSTTT
jgi:hypothetical protein